MCVLNCYWSDDLYGLHVIGLFCISVLFCISYFLCSSIYVYFIFFPLCCLCYSKGSYSLKINHDLCYLNCPPCFPLLPYKYRKYFTDLTSVHPLCRGTWPSSWDHTWPAGGCRRQPYPPLYPTKQMYRLLKTRAGHSLFFPGSLSAHRLIFFLHGSISLKNSFFSNFQVRLSLNRS